MSKPKWDRKFGGEIIVGTTDRKLTEGEKAFSKFEQKHLKAYLQGKTEFNYGYEMKFDPYGNEYRGPIVHQVKYELIKLEENGNN